MRSRKKPYTQKELENNPYIIKTPDEHKGNWLRYFGNDNKIKIEIGTGKGGFITEIANRNANTNFLGLEKEKEIIVMAARSLAKTKPKNVGLALAKGEGLSDFFSQGEVAHIYLNFSDPWPKSRYAKRRLTHRNFLCTYKQILAHGGGISFKTDQAPFFDFSLKEFEAEGFVVVSQTRDLHNTPYHLSGENITTEYETKFAAQGQPIYMVEVKKC
ncbi:MAG: tRNA (guanosine(46)-N7)-methyltransferase TrmB [Defluviitaleaceae bacterium]|nr:tRNA (guanosine(46)-N7)-methyltransferase TrmB [Defluviitaleaceae bacterium]